MSLFPARNAESFDFKEVQYEKRDWVARVTINRPHNDNAYSTPATAGHARDWLSTHYTSLEPYEGMTAFVEKRKVDLVGMRRRAADPKGSSEFLWGPYSQQCPKCETKGIPAFFEFCGKCGTELAGKK